MLVQEETSCFQLDFVQVAYELEMPHGPSSLLLEFSWIRGLQPVQSLPRTELRTHGTAHEQVWLLSQDLPDGLVSLLGIVEVPWVAVLIVDCEVKSEARAYAKMR